MENCKISEKSGKCQGILRWIISGNPEGLLLGSLDSFQIPSLNDTPLHDVKPNSLVRFRCMIQDMFDPEFYLGLYEVEDNKTGQKSMRSGKYKDVAECGVSSHLNNQNGKASQRGGPSYKANDNHA